MIRIDNSQLKATDHGDECGDGSSSSDNSDDEDHYFFNTFRISKSTDFELLRDVACGFWGIAAK